LIRVQEVYNDHKVIRYINLGRELKKQRELAAATKEEEKKKREEAKAGCSSPGTSKA